MSDYDYGIRKEMTAYCARQKDSRWQLGLQIVKNNIFKLFLKIHV